MWKIDKQFSFCYGHRVWSQTLNTEYCETHNEQCKCRHLHGHEALVHVFLEAETLINGMVTDFKHLGWLKTFLDKHLDHKFIIDIHDPNLTRITHSTSITHKESLTTVDGLSLPLNAVTTPDSTTTVGYQLNTDELSDPVEKEFYESFFFVDFVPTSEHLSKWLFDLTHERMQKIHVKVAQVDWYETPKSRASYRA